MEQLPSWIEAIKLFGLLVLPSVVLLGVVFDDGRKTGLTEECIVRRRSGDAFTRLLSDNTGAVFWKRPTLINSGAQSLAMVLILCGYVMVMLFLVSIVADLTGLPSETVYQVIPILMAFPLLMSAVVIFYLADKRKDYDEIAVEGTTESDRDKRGARLAHGLYTSRTAHRAWALAISGFAVVLSLILGIKSLPYQGAILFALAMWISHLRGYSQGTKEADPESYTRVRVRTQDGAQAERRLYSIEQQAYRFLDADGYEHHLPQSAVTEIRYVAGPKESGVD